MEALTPYIPTTDLQHLICSYTLPDFKDVIEDIEDLSMYMKYYKVSLRAMLYLLDGHKREAFTTNWIMRHHIMMEREKKRKKIIPKLVYR